MDIATIIGIVAGFGLVIGSILLGGSLLAFINIPGLLIVIGGTFAATLIAEKMSTFVGSAKVAARAFTQPNNSVEATIQRLSELANIVRKGGVLALENETIDNPFLARGVRLAVDGQPPEEVRKTLQQEVVTFKERHRQGHRVFRFMGATAPAMGMVGTLIGLVQMLQAMEDPSSIGPAMAVALLTTFYGAVAAFLVFNPIADKLEGRTKDEAKSMAVIVEGMGYILNKDNPRLVQEKLQSFQDPTERTGDKESNEPAAA